MADCRSAPYRAGMAERHRFGIGLTAVLGLLALPPAGVLWALLQAPVPPPALASVNDPAIGIDRTGLPGLAYVTARDGQGLAYRRYGAGGSPVVVLVHGSAGESSVVHRLATELARLGADVIAPDIRGHGGSGPRGDIPPGVDLADDLSDLMRGMHGLRDDAPRILAGHSLGGGFALRVGASPAGADFARVVLLAPYLGYDAPTSRADSGGWASASVPRIVALTLLGRPARAALGGLSVLAFAVPHETAEATPFYSFRLFDAFRSRDPKAELKLAGNRVEIVAGAEDELMLAQRYAPLARDAGSPARVLILPGLGHMALVADPDAAHRVAAAILESVPRP